MANKNYQSNLPRVKYVLEENEKAALKAVGKFTRAEARRILSTVAVERSGTLRKNIASYVRRKTKSIEIGVKKKAFWGLFLEKGTRKMRARPFLTPAAEENIAYIKQIIADNLGNVTNDIAPKTQTDKVET